MHARIALVTLFHIANDIRLVKEADALSAAGYDVDVFAAKYLPWAEAGDEVVSRGKQWRVHFVYYDRNQHPALFWYSRFRRKLSSILWCRLKNIVPIFVRQLLMERALDRVLPEMLSLVTGHGAELYIGHGAQSLPIVVRAAWRHRALAGFDAEDFNAGMKHDGAPLNCEDELIDFVVKSYIRRIQHVTAASPGVAEALRLTYSGVEALPILNVFPLRERPDSEPRSNANGPLRLYWFSQTIGRDRGLEEAVRACGILPAHSVELHLRGNWTPGYENVFRDLWSKHVGARAKLFVHDILPPDQMIQDAAKYDVGLALEVPISENRRICMRDLSTNKVFTYLLAGLAVAASGLEQRSLIIFDGAGFAYETGNAESLAAGLHTWVVDRPALQRAREISWRLGGERYNWEREKEKLLESVQRALSA